MKLFLKIFFIIGIFQLSSVICNAQKNYSSKSKKAIKYYEEATKFYDGRNFSAATEDLKKAIKEDDLFIEAHMLLGYIYSDLNQYSKAIEEIKKSIEINPEFYQGNYFSLARLQFSTGQYEDAKKNYVKYLNKTSASAEMNKMAERDIK